MPILLYGRNAIKGLGEAFASPYVSLCLCVFVSLCLCAASPVAVAAAPTVTISTTKSAESTGPFTATFTFSEAVTGFVATDLTVTNGTASGFSGTGTTYTATITPDNDDVVVTLTVPAGAATDAAGDANTAATVRPYPPARLQQAYVDQGQGLFIHFGLESFLGRTTAHNSQHSYFSAGQWARTTAPINLFNPSGLNTDQWADAAVEAGLRFGVLTAKHHHGFALWNTTSSTNDVFNTSWCTAEKRAGRSCDVMKRYADSFRGRGLAVGVYFSILDRVADIKEGTKTLSDGTTATDYVKAQISELLGTSDTNRPYGEIQSIWFDAWDWRENFQGYGAPEYTDIPYAEVRDHIRSISPNTLIINNDKYASFNTSDIVTYEQELDVSQPLPARYLERSWTIAGDGSWFWNPGHTASHTPRQVAGVADDINALQAKGGLTLYNFGPDARGQISTAYRNHGKLLGYATRKDNLAQGKTATQSSTYSDAGANSYAAGEATDGFFNESKGMAHTNTGASNANPWWKVDLGQEQRLDTVVVFNRTNATFQRRLSNLTVQVLDASENVVHTSATLNPNNTLNGPQGLIVHLGDSGAGVSGRYVRVNKSTTNSSNVNDVILALTEVMVFAPPSVTITPSRNTHDGTPFTATVTFNEPVTGFTLNDLTVTGGGVSNFSGAGTTYTVTITPSNGSTDVVLNVAANVATNAASRGNTAATAVTVTADTTAPNVAIGVPSAHNGRAFTATFTFSERVTGFALADIGISGGLASALNPSTGSGNRFTATIAPTNGNTNVVLSVNAGVATDTAGNANTAADPKTVTADTTAPTVTIDAPSGHNGGSFTATFTFSEAISGFNPVSIDVTNGGRSFPSFRAIDGRVRLSGGTITEYEGIGRKFTITITPDALADITLSLPAAAARDAAGNTSVAASASVPANSNMPSVSIRTNRTTHNGAGTFTATVSFSAAVTGFVTNDLTVSGGSVRSLSGSGRSYTATIAPNNERSNVVLSVAADVATDADNNGNLAATPVTVIADSTVPTVTISTTKTAESTGAFTATFTFSEAVIGFVAENLTVTNGTASGFSGTGRTYTATITPDNDDVVVTLTVPAGAATDAAGNPNTPATTRPYPPARLQQAYVDQGQGMFIHFSLESFMPVQWAPSGTNINTFNPSDLDTDQWADAAVEAGLRFGVLTAKHHNGFTLWDTRTAETGPSAHDVFETSWCTGEKNAGRSCDVMKRYADSFRSRGLGVGVYFSIWDHIAGLTKAGTENNQTLTNGTNPTDYIKQQLLELLGNSTNRPYGEIDVVWFDGWDLRENAIGNLGVPEYRDIPYAPIRDYIRSISPNTLIVNNDKKSGSLSLPHGSLTTSDIATVEQYIDLSLPLPEKYVERSWTIASDNTWFWNPGTATSEAPRQLAAAADGIILMRNKGGLTLFNFGPDARGQISTPYRNFGKLLGYAIRQDSLAQGKTATQSSTYTQTANTSAGEALDGFFSESAGMAHTNTGAANANPWWKVDLGQEQRVDTVVLFNRTNTATRLRLSNLTVQVLDASENVVHTSATLNPNNSMNGPQGLIVHLGDSGAGVSGRYVRVNKSTTNSSNVDDVILSLTEVMVFAPPSVTITPSRGAHGGTPFTATLTFSEPVTGFTLSDLTVSGGVASNFSGAGTTYTVTITPSNSSTDVVLNVAANIAINVASRGNTAATTVTVPPTDTTAPTVAIDAPSAHNGRAFAATFTFSEAVSGFDAVADITVTGGTAAAPTPVSGEGITAGTTYRAIITPATPASGEALANITLAVPAAAARDAAGNTSEAASAVTVTANNALPSVNIRTSRTTHNGAGTFTATLSFNKAVTGFVAADLTVSGGSVRSFSGSGRSYTATIAPNGGRSNVVLSVAANVATDTDNNGNLAAIPVTVIADIAAPTVTISAPSAHNGAAFTATFTFSEGVTGFDTAADITVSGGTAGAPTAVSGANITAGTTYQATITPTDNRTDVALSVAANVASDAAGNANTASAAVNVTAPTVTIDTTAPTVTISAPSAHNGRPFAATFTFNEAVSGFDAVADITVTGGTAAAPTPVGAAGTTYRATITPATPASGAALADITLAVPAAAATDAAGNTSVAASAVTVPASSNPPSVSIRSGKPEVAANDRGDLALVPYYTVMADWVTGLHIVNTSERTQVVKMRFRRATDGMDALDFNVVLSPRDVYAGFLSDTASGDVVWSSPDTTCTAPAASGNRLVMPAIYRAGADSGYVEVIAMGSPSDEQQPIAVAAASASSATGDAAVSTTGTSAAGLPRDCAALRSNFYADGAGTVTSGTTKPGVEDHATTWQRGQAGSANTIIKAGGRNTYEKSGNVLKVSYFIRDNATGIEFGDNAVHIRDFLDAPSITNQEYGLLSGDLNGFEFPDLNGGVPLEKVGADATSVQRGRFDALRASAVLGADRLLNEWSANPANGVEMNWVVTLPGQYTMLRLPQYAAALASTASASSATGTSSAAGGMGHPAPRVDSAGNLTPATVCPRQAILATGTAAAIAECDYRDLPVELEFTAYNREQRADTATATATGELVVSPTAPSTHLKTYLPQVANVITFGGKRVFGPMAHNIDVDLGQPYGWVSARVRSRDADVRVCDWDRKQDNGAGFPGASAGRALTLECSALTNKNVPVIGFAAWSRKMAANPDASYGRIVEHSYRAEAATATPPSQ